MSAPAGVARNAGMMWSNPDLGVAYATRSRCRLPLEMSTPSGSSVEPPAHPEIRTIARPADTPAPVCCVA